MNVKKLLYLFISLPKTIYFNCRVLPISKAIKLPFLIGYRTRFGKLNRNITIADSKPQLFQIKLNWGGTESRDENRKGYVSLGKNSHITFHGKSYFSSGLSLIVDDGSLEIGNGFFCNRNCCISCNEEIIIGDNVMWGWNVELLDSDNHEMTIEGVPNKTKGKIIIGNDVWLASYVHVLKDANIASGSVVAYRSLVVRDLHQENSLYGGSPAKHIKSNIGWVRKSANV